MRKTLIALMFAAALPTVAMAMPEGPTPGPMGGPEGHMMGGPGHGEHGPRGKGGPFSQLDLSKEQREQIGKLMGDQWHARKDLVKKYLDKLPPAEQKARMKSPPAARKPRRISAQYLSRTSRRSTTRSSRSKPSVVPSGSSSRRGKPNSRKKRNNASALIPQPSGQRHWAFPV